jgi:hypothetical protein
VTGACWPNAFQEQALRECFDSAVQVGLGLSAETARDPAASVLLPLLDWRFATQLPDDLAAAARRKRLALWRQSRQRLADAVSLIETLRPAGIEPVFLKGVALVAHYYPDASLRGVGDVDFMVPRERVTDAVDALARAGWASESGLSKEAIQRQMRAGHAWQFYKKGADGEERMCDMHWHPVIRCYSPLLAQMFLRDAETVVSGDAHLRIPCATDMLFHAAAHGLQWTWTTPIRWIPDALFIIRSNKVDWERLRVLAGEVQMTFRVHRALTYLKTHFDAPVPAQTLEALSHAAAPETREQKLMEKPNPLGLLDAARWHWSNFQRLRPFDPEWNNANAASAFASYLSVFFRTTGHRDVIGAVWDKVNDKSAGVSQGPR